MYWYDTLLSPLVGRWLWHYPLPKRPSWLNRLVVNHLRRWEAARVSTPFLAAQAAGIGLVDHFWPPGTTKDSILQWYDTRVVNTPCIAATGLDYFKMTMFRCTATEVAHATVHHTPLPPEQMLIQWTGPRPDWWTDARSQFADAWDPHHEGLYTVANSAATTILAVLDRPR